MNSSIIQNRLHLAGMTGRGVRVAVIDSGINPAHTHVAGVAGGVRISSSGEDHNYLDYTGHGTAVAGAIRETASEVELLAVKVFDQSLTTSIDLILRAIEWAIEHHADLINLSLGTLNERHRERFAEVVERAAARHQVMIAAREISGTAALPGSLPAVLGVGIDWDCPPLTYRCHASDEQTTFLASGYARQIPGVPAERNLNGISFAVARMTGFAALARQMLGRCDPATLKQKLIDAAQPA